MTLLQVDQLCLSLNDRAILKNIDLNLNQGEFHLVLGPNGAGKSSLLKCVLGLHDYMGTITLNNRPGRTLLSRDRARLVAYVPQFLELQFNLDVASFLALSRYAHEDEPINETERIIADALAQTETTHLVDAFIDELSGGERQRVLIAAALAQTPRLMLLDEPSTAMDPGHRRDLVKLLARLNQQEGLSLLVVTHDWNEFLHLSPKITAIKNGAMSFQCESDELKDHLSALYDCQFNHFRDGNSWLSVPTR